MSKKLQNTKAIKQMLDGTHRTQTRTTMYMGPTERVISAEDIIEKFEDGTPKVWIEEDYNGNKKIVTQHKGFKTKESANGYYMRQALDNILKVPNNCPECGCNMYEKERALNFKFYFKRKKCFGCVLEDEREIKMRGKEAWEEYQKNIMSENAEAWFKDADKEVEVLKSQIKETYWQNADGDFGEFDISEYLEKMETDYNQLKEDLRNQFK